MQKACAGLQFNVKKSEGGRKAPWKRGRGPKAPPCALPLSGADAPCASAASRPPADWLRSTLGDGGLSCRVRDEWAISRLRGRARAGRPLRFPSGTSRAPWRPHSVVRETSSSRDRPPRGVRGSREARARAISTARLNASRRAAAAYRPRGLRSPYRRENSSRRRLPA